MMTDNDLKNALPPGTVLHNYIIESVLGNGGFGIVYKARHKHLDKFAAIKEFLPVELAVRDSTQVHPLSANSKPLYEEGLQQFLKEAKQLVQFEQHPNIVSCRDFIEANGTAYLVMDYEDGLPLSTLLAQRENNNNPFSEENIIQFIVPLLEGLKAVHDHDVLHRDIKPGNIFIRRSTEKPVLIDFGAAKQNYSEQSKSLAAYTPGYAAYEQIEAEGKLGPWTDIYAIGALLWRIVAGQNPPDVIKRTSAKALGRTDPMTSALILGAEKFSESFLSCIDKCLELNEEDRFQDIDALLAALNIEFKSQENNAKERKNPPISDEPNPAEAIHASTPDASEFANEKQRNVGHQKTDKRQKKNKAEAQEITVGYKWWITSAWLSLTIGNLIILGFYPESVYIYALTFNIIINILVLQFNKYAFLLSTVLSLNPLIWIINGLYLKNRWNHQKVNKEVSTNNSSSGPSTIQKTIGWSMLMVILVGLLFNSYRNLFTKIFSEQETLPIPAQDEIISQQVPPVQEPLDLEEAQQQAEAEAARAAQAREELIGDLIDVFGVERVIAEQAVTLSQQKNESSELLIQQWLGAVNKLDELVELINAQQISHIGELPYVYYTIGFFAQNVRRTGTTPASINLTQLANKTNDCEIDFELSKELFPDDHLEERDTTIFMSEINYILASNQVLYPFYNTSLLMTPREFPYGIGYLGFTDPDDDYFFGLTLYSIFENSGPFFLDKESAQKAISIYSDLSALGGEFLLELRELEGEICG